MPPPVVLTDAEPFLDALEADPADDDGWLVFSDWLEEHGVADLPGAIREAVDGPAWGRLRLDQFMALNRRDRRSAACDCLERILPLYEAYYPNNLGPRQLVADLRQGRTRSLDDFGASRWTDRDLLNRRPFVAARGVAAVIAFYTGGACLSTAFFNAPYPVVAARFGQDALQHNPQQPYPTVRAAVRDVEYRWQVARVLRYHFGLPPGHP
jgi:uncharacterized protein (TIGR02996 family)